jgi:membrane protein implicated in regulation of membrane protease activity
MADLYTVLTALIKKQQRPAAGGKAPADALYQPGTVLEVNADGTYAVDVAGRSLVANPETDLPLQKGQRVYVSEVRNGKPVVHGPR